MAGNGSWAEFRGDLRASRGAWRAAPLLPVISVVLYLPGVLLPSRSLLFVPLLIFLLGWSGTERIWYLRLYRERSLSLGEALRFNWAFIWRFAKLWLVAGLMAIGLMATPILILILYWLVGDPENPERFFSSPVLWISWASTMFLIGFAFTFVTPALAFSTPRVGEALSLGFRMRREHWPRSAGYALVPPLVLVLTIPLNNLEWVSLGPQVLLTGVFALLNLWFKGATVAFYLRHAEVGDNGAVMSTEQARSLTSEQTRD